MREVISYQFCDAHFAQDEKVPATVNRTVALDGADPRLVDLCDTCDKELFDRLMVLLDAHSAPVGDRPVVPKPRQRDESKDPNVVGGVCPVCGMKHYNKSSTADHIWREHIGQPRPVPQPPYDCPDCEVRSSSLIAYRVHRYRLHGVDVLTDAMAEYEKRRVAR
jgi:hypothetical protein